MASLVVVCLLPLLVYNVHCVVFHIEAENFVTDKFALHRLNATGSESINFNQGQFFHVYFCLRAESEVAVADIRYSNDGGSDMFEVSIDGVQLGEVITRKHSDNGLLWNSFISTGQIGPSIKLSSGYHVITINFTSSDFFGAEIDSMKVRVEDRFLEEDLFKCSLFCLKDNMYDNGPARDDLPSIILDRRNYDINCPVEDNIILPMYHKNVDLYMISAMLPKYRSFENHRELHFETCVPPSDELWAFENFIIPDEKEEHHRPSYLTNKIASLTYNPMNNSRTTRVCVTFDKLPITVASSNGDNVDKGHVLAVRFKQVLYPFYVELRYKGKQSNWSAEFSKYFTPQVLEDIWTLSEHEWSNTDVNEMELTIVSDPNHPFPMAFEYLRLTRRRLGERQNRVIYSSKDIRAEVVHLNSELNTKESSMTVTRLDTGEKWDSISYISVSHILPWSQKYGEVLRFHQSGKLRVLPLTPPGLDKLPFGSSFIVGQSDPNERFPRAPISHIGIDPGALQLFVTYKDEGKANMIVKPSLHGTRVIIKDVRLSEDTLLSPFVTFSSMWITDGNSEVDHISSNGNKVHHIVNGWSKLYGTSFTFMKKCISKHNTQGPDMRLELLTKRELYQFV